MKKISTRQAFGEALAKLGEKYPDVVCLDADLSKSTMSMFFAEKYPKRFFEMGIQEANMIGAAAGLSFTGKIPFICSFAAFITGRFDQIRMSIGYSNANVKIIGTHAGVGIGEDGHSQMGLEDMALMRSIPNMTVLQPGTAQEAEEMVEWAIKHQGPVYLRLTRQGLSQFKMPSFELGKFPRIKEGEKIAFIGSGGLLEIAYEAASILKEKNLDPAVFNGSTVKPFSEKELGSICSDFEKIYVFEDHSKIGGLGSALSEWVAENLVTCKVFRYAVNDTFGESGTPQALYEKHGFTPEAIAKIVKTDYIP